jgi:RNAse (barnase) inhibitor barstar
MDVANGKILPLYRLIEDESQRVILTALDIEGFFVEPDRVPSHVQVFGAPSRLIPRLKRLHDVELQVLDQEGEVMGAYYVGEAEMLDRRCVQSNDQVDLDVSFLGYACPFPRAGEIWRRWASGPPRKRGEWRHLSPDWHASWLHVVQTAWFQAGRMATRYGPGNSYVMDGSGIASVASLYCELGEAINGPGGYFGSGPDALVDCLRAAVCAGSFELVWRNFDMSKDGLGEPEVSSVVSLLREFGVGMSVLDT